MYSTRYRGRVLIKLEFSQHIFEKYRNIKYHETPSSVSRDMMKLIIAFRNFANAPKNVYVSVRFYHLCARIEYSILIVTNSYSRW
jgi:hypothetical protein